MHAKRITLLFLISSLSLLMVGALLVSTPITQAAATVINTNLVFVDGFESGDTSAWGSAVPFAMGNTTNDVNNQAAMIDGAGTACGGGSCGFEVLFDNSTLSAYVQDDSPVAESSYYAGFWFDPNNVLMNAGDSHQIFRAISDNATPVAIIALRFDGTTYVLDVTVESDTGVPQTSAVVLSDTLHHLAFNWQAASASGANDGQFQFWLDNVSQLSLSDLDTDSKVVERVRLGGVSGVDVDTVGSIYFDEFVSARTLMPTGEMLLVATLNELNVRSTIDRAHSGATLFFPPSFSGQTITLTTGQLVINKALMIDGSGLETDVTISGNDASRIFYIIDYGTAVTLTHLTLISGTTLIGSGGCIEYCGGAIYADADSQVLLADSVVRGNVGNSAGGIYSDGKMTILNTEVSHNRAVYTGGGIQGNQLNIIHSAVVSNSTMEANDVAGGGIYADNGDLVIDNSTIAGNVAQGSGGGIYYAGSVHINQSTIANNTAVNNGGGLYFRTTFYGEYPISIVNSTFSGNVAGGNGGAIYNIAGTHGYTSTIQLTLTQSTLADNTAVSGGGIYQTMVFSGSVGATVQNSIIAASGGGNCVGTNINGDTHNLSDDATCSGFTQGNAGLAPLADNGGATLTRALLPGRADSLGDPLVCQSAPVNGVDQRGYPRTAVCDAGAYEAEFLTVYLPMIVK